MLVLMTDGQQTYVPGIKEPHEIAQELREDGVEILAIGIGEEVREIFNVKETDQYASCMRSLGLDTKI